METICGANCGICQFRENCRGCKTTGGRPFGGSCIAAEYIKAGGPEGYAGFKEALLKEVNSLLDANGIPQIPRADMLVELPGSFVDLAYPLPSGKAVPFLDGRKVYLGAQIEFGDLGVCYGVVADTGFILLCSYSVNGSEPELIAYQKR